MRGELTLWRPFKELSFLHRDMDDIFSRFFGDWGRDLSGWSRSGGWYPAVESYLEGDKLIVKADLPGMDPKDMEISVADNQLTIKGERKATREHKGNGNNYFYRDVRYGRFERSLPLPEGVSTDNVTARYRDGIMEITMPASKGGATRRIPVEVK